jgi:hypothetical protein
MRNPAISPGLAQDDRLQIQALRMAANLDRLSRAVPDLAMNASAQRGGISLEISGGLPMKRLSFAVSTLAISGWLAMTPVAAQERAMEPPPQLHAVNPSLSLSAPTNSPLQEQIRQDYASELMGAQRELLQQNPSGLGRQEQQIGRELNGYMGPR